MEYAVTDDASDIPEDLFTLIRMFFNQVFISKTKKWDGYWGRHSNGRIIINIHLKLLDKLTENLETQSTNTAIKRIISTRMRLCLMTYLNYQEALGRHEVDVVGEVSEETSQEEHNTQARTMENLFVFFEYYSANYDHSLLKDEHFVRMLYRFFYEDIDALEGEEYICKILK